MKSEFLQPRFDGPRFAEHTLPVDVARDLAAYEELVIELAKHLYIRSHEGRQRVPKGFEKEFNLHLERVDEGSAKPLLSWIAAAGMLLPGGSNAQYFEQARDLISDCVRASSENQPLPEAFPKNLLDYFNVVGRSLREGESVDLAGAKAAKPARLDPERRKQLVLAAQKTYLKEVEIAGRVEEVDWAKSSFRLRLDDGTATQAPFSPEIESIVREAAGRPRTRATLRGLGIYDAYDKLQKVGTTEHLEVSPNFDLEAQIDALGRIKDGWMEGAGKAPPAADLEWLTDQLTASLPPDIPLPFACPSPEGGVFLEWKLSVWIVSAEFHLPERRAELQAVNVKTAHTDDLELKLEGAESFNGVYDFVRRYA
ncbi:MAG: hypothetical protein KBA71_11450 [Opitutaceae bacterium]|nr:hypothetical protein [Opitutaceae bacterium]